MAFPIYDTQDDVPEAFREDYQEDDDDGKWKPIPDKDLTESITSLEGTLVKVRGESDDWKKAAGESKTAADEAEAARVKAQAAADAKKAGMTAEELAEMKKGMVEDAQAETASELKEARDENDRLKGVDAENRELRLDDRVKALFLSNGVTAEGVEDLFTLTRSEFDLTEDKVVKLVKHPANPVDEFIKTTLKERHPHYFEGSQAEGGDSKGSRGQKQHKTGGVTLQDLKDNPEDALRKHREANK